MRLGLLFRFLLVLNVPDGGENLAFELLFEKGESSFVFILQLLCEEQVLLSGRVNAHKKEAGRSRQARERATVCGTNLQHLLP